MKKYQNLFSNNFIISISLLAFSSFVFWMISLKFISIIIFIFLLLILFYTLQDKFESYIKNMKINKANKKEVNEQKEPINNKRESNNNKNQTNSLDNNIQTKISQIDDSDLVLIINDVVFKLNFILEKTSGNKSYKRTYNSIIDYYIPTIEKFINRYIELDEAYMENSKKQKIKRDIKNSICIINLGFQKMINEFNTDSLIDIYSDIDVLRAILIRDGLISERDFPKITYEI
ncbi:hypothetical protein OFR22_10355 [Brachyspira hyodysenteriae]|uniref:hypothetical protein n=1 Tax=Brachyspira hyodysenteriae TaxID=159 RepID=UPI0022CD5DB9|nr:hypothetical protein [Brachyspira hyodysenteriae]MCZ9851058.1 hypothetical protein [Brachyspira hyodysenteriae]MCZ9860189.1 hypothetical protein [Brachyspira hyodysenteriae]MCZ9869528.1 hypothetical protein [Brachyspira hyodysenteriae]MCZ9878882.1 hypothetical protein [Brachyspira hyodysenteriae]MCZ9895949.1 hypothetical protein [Brachyspira hyodysenteriae]